MSQVSDWDGNTYHLGQGGELGGGLEEVTTNLLLVHNQDSSPGDT